MVEHVFVVSVSHSTAQCCKLCTSAIPAMQIRNFKHSLIFRKKYSTGFIINFCSTPSFVMFVIHSGAFHEEYSYLNFLNKEAKKLEGCNLYRKYMTNQDLVYKIIRFKYEISILSSFLV